MARGLSARLTAPAAGPFPARSSWEQEPRRSQLRAGPDQALGDHGLRQVALPAGLGGDDPIQAEVLDRAQGGRHVAVGGGSVAPRTLPWMRDRGFAFERPLQGLDLGSGPAGQVGHRALAHLVAFAEGHGWPGVAVGAALDIHGNKKKTVEILFRRVCRCLHLP